MWYDDNDYVLSSISQHFGLPPYDSTTNDGEGGGLSFHRDNNIGGDGVQLDRAGGGGEDDVDWWSSQHRTSCMPVLHVDASPTFLKMDDVLSHSVSMRISGGAIPIGPPPCDYSFAGNTTPSPHPLPPSSTVAPEPPFLRRGIIVDWIFRTVRELTDPELESLLSEQEDDEEVDEEEGEGARDGGMSIAPCPSTILAGEGNDQGVSFMDVEPTEEVIDVLGEDGKEGTEKRRRRRRDRKPRSRGGTTRPSRGVARSLGNGWIIDKKGVKRNPRGDVERLRRKREEEKRKKGEEGAPRGIGGEEQGATATGLCPPSSVGGTSTATPLDSDRHGDDRKDRMLALAQELRQKRELAMACGRSAHVSFSSSSSPHPSSSRPMRAAKAFAIRELSLGDPIERGPAGRIAPTAEQQRRRSSPYPSRACATGLRYS